MIHRIVAQLIPAIILIGASPVFAESLFITNVRPSKITYLVGESASAGITIRNAGDSNVVGTLCVAQVWDLGQSTELWREELTIPAGQERTTDINWTIGDQLYGNALQVQFHVAGQPTAQRQEFFQVSRKDNWMRMFILNGGGRQDKVPLNEFPFSKVVDPFTTYTNYNNLFAYAPSDCVVMVPRDAFYYSGQTAYPVNRDKLHEYIEEAKARGVRTGGYTQTVAAGPAGYEFARQHPQWIARDQRGAFHTNGSAVSPIDIAKSPEEKHEARGGRHYYMLVPDFGHPQMRQYAAQEIARALDALDLQAMFFDSFPYGMFYYPHRGYDNTMFTADGRPLHRGKDPDVFTVEILQDVRRIIHESHPDAVLWYNGLLQIPSEPWKPLTNVAPLKGAKQAGGLLEVSGKQLVDGGPFSKWRILYEMLAASRNKVENNPEIRLANTMAGYIYDMSFANLMTESEFAASRDLWAMSNHIGAILIATHFHPCLLGSTSFRPTTQFMTRYSRFLWDEDLRLVNTPWKHIAIISNREVWWEEVCYERQLDTYKETIMHLINAPDEDVVDYKASVDPPPVRDAQVRMHLAEQVRSVEAWVVQPYGYNDEIREPKQIPMDPRIIEGAEGGQLMVLDLPPFSYHCMVVVREYP